MGYVRLEVLTAEETSQHAHTKVAEEDVEDPMTKSRCCQDLISDLLGSQRKFGRFKLAMQMKRSRRRARR